MATPLAQFSNARVLWTAPGGRGGPEVGYKELPGQAYLITAFLKQVTANKRGTFKDVIDLRISTEIFQGYVTGWLPLPEGEDWVTYPVASDSSLDATGLRPPGLDAAAPADVAFGGRVFPSAEILDAAGVFFDDGIGGIVREVIGDRLIIKFERY